MPVSAPSLFAFDNTFARTLPELGERWAAATAPAPRLLVLNDELAGELGLDPAELRSPSGVDVLSGNVVPAGAEPVAQAYAGHQFGGFSPRLGDGRALLLGEVLDDRGRRAHLHEGTRHRRCQAIARYPGVHPAFIFRGPAAFTSSLTWSSYFSKLSANMSASWVALAS